MPNRIHEYPLTVGLPHTNFNQLTEHKFLAQAGAFQWTTLARTAAMPLSRLRSVGGDEIYATFFYIEEDFPGGMAMNTYRLDDECVFLNLVRAVKNIAFDGRALFHRTDEIPPGVRESFAAEPDAWKGRLPYLRMCNVFIMMVTGNEYLKIAPPANAAFEGLEKQPADDNAYTIIRAAEETGRFSTLAEGFAPADLREVFEVVHPINPDRDTNGAGLVYFANYVAFMDWGERQAMTQNAAVPFEPRQVDFRSLQRRELAYYGNARIDDSVRIHIRMFRRGTTEIGFRYRLERESDGRLIALSEAIKTIPA